MGWSHTTGLFFQPAGYPGCRGRPPVGGTGSQPTPAPSRFHSRREVAVTSGWRHHGAWCSVTRRPPETPAFHLRGRRTVLLPAPAVGDPDTDGEGLDCLALGRTSGVASSWGAHRGHCSCAGTAPVVGVTGPRVCPHQPGPQEAPTQAFPYEQPIQLRPQTRLKSLQRAAAGDSEPQACQ